MASALKKQTPQAAAPVALAEPLDYDALVEGFENALLTKLRRHGAGLDFLELWVPDDDPLRSIVNMVESAQLSGIDRLALTLSAATAGRLKLEELRRQLAEMGEVRIGEDGTGAALVEVSRLAAWQAFQAVGPLYRRGLMAVLDAVSHDQPAPASAPASQLLLQAHKDGVGLWAQVEGRRHGIVKAGFQGGAGPAERAVFEKLCVLIEGLTIHEAADHAAIRLEYALREKAGGRPVPGIVSPRNADPVFNLPEALARELFAQYRARTGYDAKQHFFEPPPSAAWLALDAGGRRARLEQAFAAFVLAHGLPADVIQFGRFQDDVRVILSLGGDLTPQRKPALMMDLEQAIKRQVEPALHLYNDELKDVNAIRRLADGGDSHDGND